jgi:hypothetical protein
MPHPGLAGMPVPVPPCPHPEPLMVNDSKGYEMEIQMVEVHPGHAEKVTACPHLRTLAGRQATFYPGTGCAPATNAAAHDDRGPHGAVHCTCWQVAPDRVRLEVFVDEHRTEDHAQGTTVRNVGVHSVRLASIGKASRLVLARTKDGQPSRWVEVTVRPVEEGDESHQVKGKPSGAAECCELAAANGVRCPYKEMQAEIAALWAALSDMAGFLSSQVAPAHVQGVPLPSPCYLQHPPQYFPPAPNFPLDRELAGQEAVAAQPEPGAPMPLPPPVPATPTGLTTNRGPTDGVTVHVIKKEGKSQLDIDHGSFCNITTPTFTLAVKDQLPLTLSVDEGQVQVAASGTLAVADAVVIGPGGQLRLDGHVKVVWRRDGQNAQIKASHVNLNLESGRLEVAGSQLRLR